MMIAIITFVLYYIVSFMITPTVSGCAFSNNLVTGYTDFDFYRIFDIRRPPTCTPLHVLVITPHDKMHAIVKIKNVLKHVTHANKTKTAVGLYCKG